MLQLETKSFEELSITELYELLKLRSQVFVVEQNCVYADLDDKDYKALHVLGYYNGQMVAYARILPQGLSFKETSIGRVLTHVDFRKLQFGKQLMEYSIDKALQHFKTKEIVISAQQYLERFYTGLLFKKESDPYMEDHIPHIQMRYKCDL